MATPSPMNRPGGYGATIRPGVSFGSIADRPTRTVGSGPMTAERRFKQLSRQLYSRGDVAGSAQALGMSERLGAGYPMPSRGGPVMGPGFGPGMPPQQPPARPSFGPGMPASDGPGMPASDGPGMPPQQSPARPSFGPGMPASDGPGMPASDGPGMPASDGPGMPPQQPPARPSFGPDPAAPVPFGTWYAGSPLAGAGPAPGAAPVASMTLPHNTPPDLMAKLNTGAFAGSYGAAPAPYDAQPIAGTGMMGIMRDGKPLGQVVPSDKPQTTSYTPVSGMPGLMVPTGPGADKLPTMQQTENPGWSITGQPKTTMKPFAGGSTGWKPPQMHEEAPAIDPATGRATGKTRHYFWAQDPKTGLPKKTYALDADGDGIPDNQQQQGAASPAPAAPAASAPAARRTTPGGFSFSRAQ